MGYDLKGIPPLALLGTLCPNVVLLLAYHQENDVGRGKALELSKILSDIATESP
jgi:hypothetical protein